MKLGYLVVVAVTATALLISSVLAHDDDHSGHDHSHEFKPSNLDRHTSSPSQIDKLFTKYSSDGQSMNSTELRSFLFHFVDLMRLQSGRGDQNSHNSKYHEPVKVTHNDEHDHSHDDHDHDHDHDHGHGQVGGILIKL